MALFSNSFSFDTPTSRPDSLYTFDSPSPTSSRSTTPSSPSTSILSSTNSSTDDLFTITSHLSSSSIYPSSSRSVPGRRSPPRSAPFALPPSCAQQVSSAAVSNPQFATDLLARRERRQAYTQEQMSGANRRRLSLLVARMLGDEIPCSGSRRHPNDGLHPSDVRVVPAMPSAASRSRRNTLVMEERYQYPLQHQQRGMESVEEKEMMMGVESGIVQSIEMDAAALPIRTRESANRVAKKVRKTGARGTKR